MTPVSNHDTLTDFALRFMARPIDTLLPVAVYNFGQVVTLVLYRDPPFQVELIIVRPGGGFPEEHRHPDVDSYEVHFLNDIPLTLNGKPAIAQARRRPSDRETRELPALLMTLVTHHDWHGATTIPEGGAFLSIQKWLNGVEPSSVGINWEGLPVSKEHERQLTR